MGLYYVDWRIFMKPHTEITKKCALCEIGRLTADGKNILCEKKGVMELDDKCGKFKYDPLKREPKLPQKRSYSADDFSL